MLSKDRNTGQSEDCPEGIANQRASLDEKSRACAVRCSTPDSFSVHRARCSGISYSQSNSSCNKSNLYHYMHSSTSNVSNKNNISRPYHHFIRLKVWPRKN